MLSAIVQEMPALAGCSQVFVPAFKKLAVPPEFCCRAAQHGDFLDPLQHTLFLIGGEVKLHIERHAVALMCIAQLRYRFLCRNKF